MAEVAVASGTQTNSDEKQRWYGKGLLHLVMEIPVSENQCEEFGFWCVPEGFLQGVSMLHPGIFE